MQQFPIVDGARQGALTDEQVHQFREHGLLIVRNLLSAAELETLQRETLSLVERARREAAEDPFLEDYVYVKHAVTGNRVPSRVEYVIDKSPACRALLAQPFILRSVEKLQGPSFIPTWDSMVFKFPGEGAQIDWHRDASSAWVQDRPIFNVDFYLDASDLSNCLWGIPGTHRLSDADASARIAELGAGGFGTTGALPIPMNPGDVLFHDILTLHGSPPARSNLRRVIYYEFRPIQTELELGPHTRDYVELKQRVLLDCLEFRRERPYARQEVRFSYAPESRFAPPESPPGPESLRVVHARHWRSTATGAGARMPQ